MSQDLIIPALALGLLGWLTPKLWSMVLPEGVRPLFLNAVLSTLSLIAITALYFISAYWLAGISLSRILDEGLLANIRYFGRLGLGAGIIWGPMMALSLMALPRYWVRAQW